MTAHAVLITGMHRSGTSALARVVNLMGIDLGDGLMAAADDNAKGFFEQEEIVGIQERLLIALGAGWNTPFDLPNQWQEAQATKDALQDIASITDSLFSTSEWWGIKDPRTTLLLPAWLAHLTAQSIQPHILIAYRHPMEVAASLHRRDNLPMEAGLAIWLHYHIMAERHSRRQKRAIISYDALLEDWQSELTNAATHSAIIWPKHITQAEEAIHVFLSPELRHHRSAPKIPNFPLKSCIEQAMSLTDTWHQSGKTTAKDWNALYKSWRAELDYLAPLSRDAVHNALYHSPVQAALDEAQQIAAEQQASIQENEKQIKRLCNELEEKYAIEEQAKELAQQLDAMQSSLSWRVTAPLRRVKSALTRKKT